MDELETLKNLPTDDNKYRGTLSMRDKPHPHPKMKDSGLSERDYVDWLLANARDIRQLKRMFTIIWVHSLSYATEPTPAPRDNVVVVDFTRGRVMAGAA
jgi:hypothetical protein